MKKLLVILFALGLVFSFTAPVMATDVSFDGSFRVRGWYDSNSALVENSTSSAYYDQRFRLGTTFQVAEGLKVVVRADALDGIWGDDLRSPAANTGTGVISTVTGLADTGTGAINHDANIQFDKAYVSFVTGVGLFNAGFDSWGVWGTGFGNEETFVGQIGYKVPIGDNMVFALKACKVTEGDRGNTFSDLDDDKYVALVAYFNDTMQAGLLYGYYRFESFLRATPYFPIYKDATAHAVIPYFKLTLGDLYIESEVSWVADGAFNSQTPGVPDIDLEGLAFYLKGQYNMGSMYLGALFAYVQGDDPTTANTSENAAGIINSGPDWDPMLILFNDNCPTTLGSNGVGTALAPAMTGTSMNNGSIYQVFAGTTIDKLSLKASLSMAKADEKGVDAAGLYADKDYGTEFDLEASYKIYDNLTYSAGFGYLWAGDYYKGANVAAKIDDTYLLMNKLQVVF